MINQIYPSELQLNKAYLSDTEAPFLDLHLTISDGFVSSKIYNKRDNFDFDIVNFPFLDGDIPRAPSYGVYISQLIRFARVSSHVAAFNIRKKLSTKHGHPLASNFRLKMIIPLIFFFFSKIILMHFPKTMTIYSYILGQSSD